MLPPRSEREWVACGLRELVRERQAREQAPGR
jgi:hypothetical protein